MILILASEYRISGQQFKFKTVLLTNLEINVIQKYMKNLTPDTVTLNKKEALGCNYFAQII